MSQENRLAIALLLMRVGVGSLVVFLHGVEKVENFANQASSFPDPLGVSPTVTLTLVIFAEVVCGAAFIFGFLTRLASVSLGASMFVAAFIVNSSDPSGRELALLYLLPVLAVLLVGPGRFSIDSAMEKRGSSEAIQ